MNYTEAKIIADEYVSALSPFCHRVEIAGSIRRKKQTDIKDVEIVLIPRPDKSYELFEYFKIKKPVKGKFPGKYIKLKHCYTYIDIFITTVECWGCIYFIRTGSAEFVKSVVSHAPELLMKFHEGRLWRIDSHTGELLNPLYTAQESDVFRELGIPHIEPEKRNRAIRIKA